MRRVIVAIAGSSHANRRRIGAATLDYILALGIVLPLLVVVLPVGKRAMQRVFELSCTLISWPFM